MLAKKTLALITTLILSSCGNLSSQQQINNHPFTNYLPNIESSANNISELYLLTKQGKTKLAKQYFHNHPPQTALEKVLLTELKLQQKKYATACKITSQLDQNELTQAWQAHSIDQLFSCQAAQHKDTQALNTLIAGYQTNPLLQNQQYFIKIWDFLYNKNPHQLEKIQYQTQSKEAKAWAELVALAKSPLEQINQQQTIWQQNNQNHPGNMFIRNSFALANNNIALLIPTNGPLKTAGQAIKKGFFAAFYQAKRLNLTHPQKIKIYNTYQADMHNLYQQIQQDSIDIILGPITKDQVQELSNINHTIPTIALNAIPDSKPNLFELDMRLEDEAQQMANYAFYHGSRKAFICSSNNPTSQRISAAFKKQWSKLGGTVITEITTDNLNPTLEALKESLGINASKARYSNLKQTLQIKDLHFTPRRRQDIDSIFLTTNYQQSKNINPLLKYLYVNGTPVYATSQVYSHNKIKTHDLDGIKFCQAPWIANNLTNKARTQHNNDQLSQHLRYVWPRHISTKNKFFTIGIDAYQLIFNINKLTTLPLAYLAGGTGALYLDNQQHIKRKLKWLKINNATIHEINNDY